MDEDWVFGCASDIDLRFALDCVNVFVTKRPDGRPVRPGRGVNAQREAPGDESWVCPCPSSDGTARRRLSAVHNGGANLGVTQVCELRLHIRIGQIPVVVPALPPGGGRKAEEEA